MVHNIRPRLLRFVTKLSFVRRKETIQRISPTKPFLFHSKFTNKEE
mgnify:CR=1 FL=1